MRPRTLSRRLFVVVGIALLPALVISAFIVLILQRQSADALRNEAYRAAELASLELAQIVSGVENVLITVAAIPAVKRGDVAGCSAVINQVVGNLLFLSALVVVDADGTVRCRSDAAPSDQSYVNHDYFRTALATGERVTGTTTVGLAASARRLPIAMRIGGTEGAPLGVAVAYLDLDWLQAQLAEHRVADRNSLAVADRTGVVLARVPDPERFVGTTFAPENRWLLTAPEPGTTEVTSTDGIRRVLGFFPASTNASGLYVSAGASVVDGFATMRWIAIIAAIVVLGGVAIAILLAFYTARVYIAKPVLTLIDTVSAWRKGDSSARTDENGEICGAGQMLDAFMDELVANREAKSKSEEERALLRDELEHRVKNLLATVQAIARQTFPKAGNDAAMEAFSRRLVAIGEANKLLKQTNWQSTSLHAVAQTSVAPFTGSDGGRVRISGPQVIVRGNVALAISMALHELCTNAVKYGALSNDSGKVSIDWEVVQDASSDRFALLWKESGGPPVVPPEQSGFGSRIIKQALASQIGGTVEIFHEPSGIVCQVVAPSENVLGVAEAA